MKVFAKSDIGKDGLFSSKAKKKYRALKKQQGIARERALSAFENAADAAAQAGSSQAEEGKASSCYSR